MAETRQITVKYDDIKKRVKTQMSIIGKRLTDTQGHILYTGVTLSSAEESVLKQYTKDAVYVFSGQLSPQVDAVTDTEINVAFLIKDTRINDFKAQLFEDNFRSYVAAYVAYDILTINRLDIAKKYAEDMANHVNAALQLLCTADAPEASGKTLSDMKGEVILEE
jgi:hypothetical protein